MAYGKHIVGPHLKFASMWGPTLYTNTISLPAMLTIGIATHEPSRYSSVVWSHAAVSILALSCVVGVAISYLGWKVRTLSRNPRPELSPSPGTLILALALALTLTLTLILALILALTLTLHRRGRW